MCVVCFTKGLEGLSKVSFNLSVFVDWFRLYFAGGNSRSEFGYATIPVYRKRGPNRGLWEEGPFQTESHVCSTEKYTQNPT